MEKQTYDESVFNMALAYLKRIDRILSFSDYYSMRGDIYGWTNQLMLLYREISIKLGDKEKLDINGSQEDTYDLDNLTEKDATLRNINLICNNPINVKKYRKQILFLLHNVEIKMREVMQRKSMLLPTKDDPRRAITQR